MAGTFAYNPPLGTVLSTSNNQTLSVTFTPSDTTDYTTATDSVPINVTPVTPTITWSNPATISTTTPRAARNWMRRLPWQGAFVYNPPAGTTLSAGSQTLSVTFTPNDTTDYTTATDSVSINVTSKTIPVITWLQPGKHQLRYGPQRHAT